MSAIDLGMDFQMPKNQSSQIKVMGIGGGGSNAAATARVAGTVGLVRNAVKVHGWRIEDLALFHDQLTPITIARVMQGYANDNTSWLGSPKNPRCIDSEITVGKT